MSYPYAMALGMTTLVFLFLPGYIWLRQDPEWSAWDAFFACAGALVPWTIFCVICTALVNLFRRQPAYATELLPAPIFTLFYGVPFILAYEFLGLRWFLIVIGALLGLLIAAGVTAALLARRSENSAKG